MKRSELDEMDGNFRGPAVGPGGSGGVAYLGESGETPSGAPSTPPSASAAGSSEGRPAVSTPPKGPEHGDPMAGPSAGRAPEGSRQVSEEGFQGSPQGTPEGCSEKGCELGSREGSGPMGSAPVLPPPGRATAAGAGAQAGSERIKGANWRALLTCEGCGVGGGSGKKTKLRVCTRWVKVAGWSRVLSRG